MLHVVASYGNTNLHVESADVFVNAFSRPNVSLYMYCQGSLFHLILISLTSVIL